ncbi:hypothetical protein D3C74_414670 [compost metagenome]
MRSFPNGFESSVFIGFHRCHVGLRQDPLASVRAAQVNGEVRLRRIFFIHNRTGNPNFLAAGHHIAEREQTDRELLALPLGV